MLRSARRAVLTASVGFFVLFLYLFSPFLLILIGWFLDPFSDLEGAAIISHRVHEVTFGLLFAVALVGALAQLRRPERNVAGMQQALVAVLSFVVVSLFTTGFEPVTLAYLIPICLAVWAHPERRKVLLPRGRPHAHLLFLAAIALFGLAPMIGRELAKASNAAQGHQSHWGTIGAFAITMAGLALLTSLRQPGWRVTATSTTLALSAYGAASVVFPFDASARADGWPVLAWIWSALVLTVAFLPSGRPRTLPLWGRVAGWVVAVPLGLFAGLIWTFPTGPPRIPHQVEAAQLDRAGCLACHLESNASATGATPTPHPDERCGDDPADPTCILGQSGCLACHRLNPGAIGSAQAWQLPSTQGEKLVVADLQEVDRW